MIEVFARQNKPIANQVILIDLLDCTPTDNKRT